MGIKIILPLEVTPTDQAVKMFGIMDATHKLNIVTNIYVIEEDSGILRSGFTTEFYLNNKTYFTWKTPEYKGFPYHQY